MLSHPTEEGELELLKVPPALKAGSGWPWDVRPGVSPLLTGDHLPRFSIVTPNLNHGRFLETCIRSVLMQGYPNVEYFVMDGGSTDESLDICRHYRALLSWESQADSGQSAAINRGWLRGTGEIFAWLNSDDLLMPRTLYEVAHEFAVRPDAGLIFGKTVSIDTEGNFLRMRGEPFDVYRALEIAHHDVAQPSVFIHRRALDRVGLLDETLHKSMDWDLWVRVALTHPYHFVPRVWSINRRWPGQKTTVLRCSATTEYIHIVNKAVAEFQDDRTLKVIRRRSLASSYARGAAVCFEAKQYRRSLWLALKGISTHPVAAMQRVGLFRSKWT